MKKIYLLCGVLLAGSAAISQHTNPGYSFAKAPLTKKEYINGAVQSEVRPSVSNGDRALNILWTEDFSGTGALTTNNGVYSTGGTNGTYWTVSNSTSHMFTSIPFAMDGRHLRWDSYNPNSSEANFATTVVNGHITTPTMDLSGQSNGAIVEFNVGSMYCCNYEEKPWYMYVSEDNGATWSVAIPMDYGVDRNVATEDIQVPMTYSVDITPFITNTPSTVQLRFSWEATNADGNGQINTHYYWMIDNIVVYESPQYDVLQTKMYLEDIVAWYEYGEISLNQAQPLTIQSIVKSQGTDSPTNFALEVTVYDGSMSQIHQSTGGTLANGPVLTTNEIDTITFTTAFDLSTLALGEYTVRAVTVYDEADENPVSDTLFRTFEITQNSFSHMNYDIATGQSYQGGGALEGFEIGASFLLYEDAELHGVNVFIGPGSGTNPTDTDTEFLINLYYWDGSAYSYLGDYEFTLTSSMLNQMNTLNFHEAEDGYTPLQLTAGTEYVATMSVFDGVVIWYGNTAADDDNSGRLYQGGTWYLSGDEPMISLNFDQSLAVEKMEYTNFSIGQNYPNPFDNTSTITYSLNETSDVSVQITDATGKVVQTITPGTLAAGTYTLTIDGTSLAAGLYYYTFNVNGTLVTNQMIVSAK